MHREQSVVYIYHLLDLHVFDYKDALFYVIQCVVHITEANYFIFKQFRRPVVFFDAIVNFSRTFKSERPQSKP